MYDYNDEFITYGAQAKKFKHPGTLMTDYFKVPVHPSAVKYYKDSGMWRDEDEEIQQERMNELAKAIEKWGKKV